MADITMPQLGETVTEGTITKWLKQVGDEIKEDDVLFEVSTDKVDSEVPSPHSGFLTEILVQEGETVEVGAKLAVISDAPAGNGSAPAAAPAEAETPAQAQAETPAEGDDTAMLQEEAKQAGASELELGADSGAEGELEAARAPEPEAPAAEAKAPAGKRPPDARPPARPGSGGGGSKVLSPVVRRLIAEHDLNPDEINGTGQGGRITRADVLDVIDARGGASATPAAKQSAPVTGPAAETPARGAAPAPARPAKAAAAPAVRAGERDEVIPFSNIRRRTAEHMVRSLDTSAHTLVVVDVDYENVDKVRRAQKNKFKAEEGFSLTYLPFIARAVIDAIAEFPHVNASVGDEQLIVHRYVNLGIAVDMNFEGLIVPVIHDADTKRLRALAREMTDLGTRAKARKVTADEISGGTFTLTNAGGFGTVITAPIINQPQVGIIGTEGIKPRPVAVELADGSYGMAVHPVGHLAMSFDHRAYDGAYAAAFLAKVRDILQTRDWAAELA